jgi:hypothetical protein
MFYYKWNFPWSPRNSFYGSGQKEILSVQPYGKTDFAKKLWFQGFPLADERLISGEKPEEEIDILIGADQYWSIVKPENQGLLSALLCPFSTSELYVKSRADNNPWFYFRTTNTVCRNLGKPILCVTTSSVRLISTENKLVVRCVLQS